MCYNNCIENDLSHSGLFVDGSSAYGQFQVLLLHLNNVLSQIVLASRVFLSYLRIQSPAQVPVIHIPVPGSTTGFRSLHFLNAPLLR